MPRSPARARPWRDFLAAADAMVADAGGRGIALCMGGILVGWWLYVPLHELFHAWACQLAGGTVYRLEIDALYGGAWLASVIPYVVPASEYAGRLSGFDTGGSDAIYLVTVLGPFVLTPILGIPVLHRAIVRRQPALIGAALPWAYAPFVSLTGDYYEAGSIIVARIASVEWPGAGARWISDDLPALVIGLFGSGGDGGVADLAAIAAALALGTTAAWLTYRAGGLLLPAR